MAYGEPSGHHFTIKEMRGVVHAFPLNVECREKILEIESNITAALGIKVINEGVIECLKRQYIICIIKRASFRPPPEPTVMLISDDGVVLGEEVLPHFKKEFLANVKEDIIWLSEEFVMYPERKGQRKEYLSCLRCRSLRWRSSACLMWYHVPLQPRRT